MKKVLTIGGATQDIYLHYDGADYMSITQKKCHDEYMIFKSGEKIEVENILKFSGGGATNSAVSFKRLGFETECFCKIGNDSAGEFILNDLKKEGVECSRVIKSSQESSGISFVINSLRRERTIFAYRGANGQLENGEIPFEQIKKYDQIYITSLSHKSSKLLPQIVDFAKKENVPIAINPGISQLAEGAIQLKESLKQIETLIMNSSEAKTFMISLIQRDETYKKAFETRGTNECNEKNEGAYLITKPFIHENFYFSIVKFFKEILQTGPKVVVITDGKNGVYAATKEKIMFQPSIQTNVIDTLGAGDSFGSCFVASLMQNKTIEESLQRGVFNSSSVISQMGAKPGLLTKNELENKAPNLTGDFIQRFKL